MSQPTPFQRYLLNWYARHGRAELPWRQTSNPYHILVSELMLQQTQVERVIPKFTAFITRFPTAASLALAPFVEVLTLWQGLGYNRRAKYLQQTAKTIQNNQAGIFPTNFKNLQELPGVGPYTAGAICIFAYNQPLALIETNIRAVFLYHFFPLVSSVPDSQLMPLITAELWKDNPREWYGALMDYGSHLKKTLPNPSRQSKHHTTQTKFTGSIRQVRGSILRQLTRQERQTRQELLCNLTGNIIHLESALNQLLSEHLVEKSGNLYYISPSVQIG